MGRHFTSIWRCPILQVHKLSRPLRPGKTSAYASPRALPVMPPLLSGSSIRLHHSTRVCICKRILSEFLPYVDNLRTRRRSTPSIHRTLGTWSSYRFPFRPSSSPSRNRRRLRSSSPKYVEWSHRWRWRISTTFEPHILWRSPYVRMDQFELVTAPITGMEVGVASQIDKLWIIGPFGHRILASWKQFVLTTSLRASRSWCGRSTCATCRCLLQPFLLWQT